MQTCTLLLAGSAVLPVLLQDVGQRLQLPVNAVCDSSHTRPKVESTICGFMQSVLRQRALLSRLRLQ